MCHNSLLVICATISAYSLRFLTFAINTYQLEGQTNYTGKNLKQSVCMGAHNNLCGGRCC